MENRIEGLKKLINKYSNDIEYYRNSTVYNEHNCRLEFIDPFFKLLNWDMSNSKGKKPQFREVITENYSSETGRPDYSMTLNGIIKFYIEAKKPAVNIEKEIEPALQVRRYGWSSKLKISVLTNFEYLIIYDTTVPPKEGDEVNVAAIRKYHYTEYIDKFNEIISLLDKNNIYNGNFDIEVDKICNNVDEIGLQVQVDEYFLNNINKWRLELGNYLYKNKDFSIEIINDLIQEFINQIIFLRICEDRNLPLYHKLKELLSEEDLIKELNKLFIEAENKYDSGLFKGNYLIFDLNNSIIRNIIEELYYPKSPYQFDLIQPNILGEIYELFLCEELSILNDEVVLQCKPRNINRDVVTTPDEIVKYMVDKTMQLVCKNKTPEEILNLRIIDISCGSGIFLIEVYEWIIHYASEWYKKEDPSFILPIEYKTRLLQQCIYGIDIDIHAVEVAKFNLYLKLLENETKPTLKLKEKILPDLKNNILCGNSLIDFNNINYKKLTDEDKEQIQVFDWSKVNNGDNFDVIIGNPPYVATEFMIQTVNEKEFEVYKKAYKTSHRQFDKYYLFIERAIEKLKYNGYLSYIVPNKFSKVKSGEKLRSLLSKNQYVKEYIDFGSLQLFKKRKKTVYSSILMLQKTENKSFNYQDVDNLSKWFSNNNIQECTIPSNVLGKLSWALTSNKDDIDLINMMYRNSVELQQEADIFTGIQTSAERPPIYWFSTDDIIKEYDDTFLIKKFNKEYIIEKSILRQYYKPVKKNEKNIGSYDIWNTNKYIIFPYDEEGNLYDIGVMENKFCNTFNYLKDNYEILKPKQIDKRGKRDVPLAKENTWYQYGRSQGLKAFNNREKLIVGILSKKPMYIYDKNNLLISSGDTAGYCAIARKQESKYELEYIQAYLTHPYMEKLFSIIGSDFESGYYSRGKSLLDKVPFKILDFNNKNHCKIYNDVVSNTRRIYEINSILITDNIRKSKKETLENEKMYLIKNIEELISKVYSI